MKPPGMTVEQRRRLVAKEFFVDCNMGAAYTRVYQTKNIRSATVAAGRLLTNVDMIKYLQEEFALIQARLELQQDQALQEICLLSYSSLKNVAKWGPWGMELTDSEVLDDDLARTIQEVQSFKKTRRFLMGETPVEEEEVRTKLKLHSKTSALGMLQEFFKRGDPLSGEVDQKIAALAIIMSQYVAADRLAAFRAHVSATLGIRFPDRPRHAQLDAANAGAIDVQGVGA